ncbi:MAG: hypothetical protein Kow0019_15200 [Methanobacteriaceae archaeon]
MHNSNLIIIIYIYEIISDLEVTIFRQLYEHHHYGYHPEQIIKKRGIHWADIGFSSILCSKKIRRQKNS